MSEEQPVKIQFTGSGSEYFRIWIVNTLLTILTLGIYSAWAKVRREKFFHQHTLIGDSNLEYHGKPIPILKGRLLVFGLFALTQFAAINPTIQVAALAVFSLAFPFLMQRSLRFRLLNTSYRGLRFNFAGTAKQAYRVLVPIIVVGVVILGTMALLSGFFEEEKKAPPGWLIGAFLLIALLSTLLYPYFLGIWKVFAVRHSQFGSIRTQVNFEAGGVVRAYLKAALIVVVPLVALALFFWLTDFYSGFVSKNPEGVKYVAIFLALIVLFYVSLLLLAPTFIAMLHNYIWNGRVGLKLKATQVADGFSVAEFRSDLSIRRYVGLQVKNFLLTVLSGGLYRPFAAVASAKMRLESVSLSDGRFIDAVTGSSNGNQNAIGAEAMDAVDMDFSM
jgi:uncharacterized membrane protein YjgN (DUF898 family)